MSVETINREEEYLAALAGLDAIIPEPITRKEKILLHLIRNPPNGATQEQIATAVNAYLGEELKKEESVIASKEYVNNANASKVPINNNGWNLVETEQNEFSFSAEKNYSGSYVPFKTPIILPVGTYVVKSEIKCSETFKLNLFAKLISTDSNYSVSSTDIVAPCGNFADYQEVIVTFNVTSEATFKSIYYQYLVSDTTVENICYIRNLQLVKVEDKDLPYINSNISGYMNNFKETLKVPRKMLSLEPFEDWIPRGYFYSHEQEYIKAVAMLDGQLSYNSPNGRIIRYMVNSGHNYLLVAPNHKKGFPICIEYETDDLTKPSNVIVSDETNIYGIVKFNENTKYVAVCSHMCATAYMVRIPFNNEIWSKDMYPYEEVLKEGYLPNPDSGVLDWDWNLPSAGCEYVNNIFDDFTFGQFYNRYSWAKIWNEETREYDFTAIQTALEKAITYKTRMQIGAFSSLYPAHEDYVKEYDDKVVWYNFPSYIYDIAYEAELYPLKLIQYTNKKVNNKPVYNAVIDWRNDEVRSEYRIALEKFSQFLNTESSAKIPYRKIVSSIQIRFFGKYGEGHNEEMFTEFPNDHEDSDVFISIVDMYLEFFDDIRLIAPLDGKSSDTLKDGLYNWQKYYLTAENSVGKFGIFNDHIGASISFKDTNRNYDGLDLMKEFSNRYMVAPVTGENFNNGEYGSDLLTLQFLLNDVQHYRYNTYRWNNVTGIGKTPSYRHPSVKKMIQKSFDMCGYRLFFVPIAAYIESNKVNAKFRIGNMGLTPCYSNYWNAQLVIRDSNGNELQVIDNIFDCKTVSMMKEPMTPCWKYMDVVSINEPCLSSVDYTGAKFYLRVIDTDGISNNMYLSNIDRTENGEYLLF